MARELSYSYPRTGHGLPSTIRHTTGMAAGVDRASKYDFLRANKPGIRRVFRALFLDVFSRELGLI